jgi:DNA polymerase elongation subunit (family B)
MEYIWNRAKETGIIDEFSIGLGRLITRKCSLVEQKLSSSALGDNILNYLDMDGMVLVDLLKVMQREQKLDSYKLDNVASIFLGDKKNDLKPQEIFEKFRGTAEDRCVIAKYCIQDCCLVNRLIHKLKILENNIGMGNVCLVPLNYLFRRGQGIKIFSLVAKQCMDRETLIPTIKSYNENADYDTDGYEGAVVLEPKEGIYLNEPVVVFDYGSLYPSSMIARNLSHDTYVLDKKYMVHDDLNIEYMKVCHDIYEGVGDKKKKTGVKECIFAQYKDGRKGIIPEILNMLLQERKNTRKKIEYQTAILKDGGEVFGCAVEKDDVIEYQNIDTGSKTVVNKCDIVSVKDTYGRFEQDVFDSLQLAYKITANSLYGQIGARTSSIYLKDIAASTTATGREMIMLAKEFVETNYNAEVIYGDSVMPYTPITCLLDDCKIVVNTFENIHENENAWTEYRQFKPNDTDRFDKEQMVPANMKVWTHKGWAQVRRIIRHRTTKKIYRVLTHTGLVDVTEDHSLLDKNCQIIKPCECVVGQELLHSQPVIPENTSSYSTEVIDTDRLTVGLKFSSEDQVSAQSYYIVLQNMGYNVYTSLIDDEIHLTYSKEAYINNVNSIQKIQVLHEAYDGYVYDIETVEGVFHAGIGNMILKNTDSIFCKFPLKDGEQNAVYGKDALPYAIKIGQHVEKNIVQIMPKPQKLNYEKCLYPFILFSKKRYVGNLYETDVNKFKQKSMGIVLKRRDNAPIVKKIYGGVIDIILNKQDLRSSIEFLQEELQDLVDGKTPISDLVISKSLRASYKDPSKIAHKVLADRIGARDPGNRPVVNERVPFVYIKTDKPNALQGDRIENPEYIVENRLIPDYLHYITNQIMKPVLQLYTLCLDQLPGYDKSDEYWLQVEEGLLTKTLYADDTRRKARIESLKVMLVKELLFDRFINMLCEPKKKRTLKAKDTAVITVNPEKKPRTTKKNAISATAATAATAAITKATIKITKSKETGNIVSEAHVLDGKKKVWTYSNNIKSDRDTELIKVIIALIEHDKNTKYIIKVNCAPFVKDYTLALAKYNEMVRNKETDVVENAIKDLDAGKIKDIGSIKKYWSLLEISDKFQFEVKAG